MTTKMILAALAAVLSGTSIESQFHSIDDLGPITTTAKAPAPQATDAQDPIATVASVPSQERTVSLTLESATIEVLARAFRGLHVNFVIPDDGSNRKINLNMTDVPLSEAIEAIGSALGGSFEKKGSVYVFHKGAQGWAAASSIPFSNALPSEALAPMARIGSTAAPARQLTIDERKELERSMVELRKDLATIKPMNEKEMKALEESLRSVRSSPLVRPPHEMTEQERKAYAADLKKKGFDVKFYSGPSEAFAAPRAMTDKERRTYEVEMKKFGEDMKKFGQEMKLFAPKAMSEKDRKAFEIEMQKSGKADDIRFFMYDGDYKSMPMTEKDRKAFEVEMKKRGVDGAFRFSPMDEKQRKAFEADMKKRGVDGAFRMAPMDEKQRKAFEADMKKRGDDVRYIVRDGKAIAPAREAQRGRALAVEGRAFSADQKKIVEREMVEARKALASSEKAMKEAKSVEIRAGKTKDLYKSITKDQWAKHEKQGFLRLSDLTPAQREMLGLSGTGELTIQMNVDGKKLTIKN